jgi:adenylate cyclase
MINLVYDGIVMNYNPQFKRKIRISLRLIAFGICAGLFFVVLSDGTDDWYPLVNGATIGFLIAVLTSIFELQVYEKRIRKQSFIVVLAIRSSFYFFSIVAIIICEIGVARMLKDNIGFSELMKNEAFNNYIFGGEFVTSVFYTFALVVLINFHRQISRKLGDDVFNSMITGKNYHPRETEKIFMFLNIPSSAVIINEIGRMKFHQFINEIAHDITLPILSNYGKIYQYVEDEMVILWKVNEGIKNANIVRCYFDIKDKINERKEIYIKKYGIVPKIKAALHYGTVVKGEIGLIRSEVVYHGDVMNTTSRILEACRNQDNELLVSAELMQLIELPPIYSSEKCSDIKLRSKKEPMELYKIAEKDLQKMSFG